MNKGIIKNVRFERAFDKHGQQTAQFLDYEIETSTGRVSIWISRIFTYPGSMISTTRRVVIVNSDKYPFVRARVRRGDIAWIKKFDADQLGYWLQSQNENKE